MTKTRVAAIWAEDNESAIGDGRNMLWRIPADMQFFKQSTMGCPVIMGRTSYDAMGAALPGRTNIVISRDPHFSLSDAKVVGSFQEALFVAKTDVEKTGADTIWVTGGSQIYRLAMDHVDELVVSHVNLVAPDSGSKKVFAPTIDSNVWELDPNRSDREWRPKSGDAKWRVAVYRRK